MLQGLGRRSSVPVKAEHKPAIPQRKNYSATDVFLARAPFAFSQTFTPPEYAYTTSMSTQTNREQRLPPHTLMSFDFPARFRGSAQASREEETNFFTLRALFSAEARAEKSEQRSGQKNVTCTPKCLADLSERTGRRQPPAALRCCKIQSYEVRVTPGRDRSFIRVRPRHSSAILRVDFSRTLASPQKRWPEFYTFRQFAELSWDTERPSRTA